MRVADAIMIGWHQVDITPPRQVALLGQNYMRIATPEDVHDPLTATALIMEAADGEQAIMVSADLVIAYDLGIQMQARLAGKIPGLDLSRLMLFVTHTHTGPYLSDKEGIPEGTMTGTEYREFLYAQLEAVIVGAWERRQPGSVGWARGEAAVGYCRIACYADGHAKMYGDTSVPDFVGMQGPHDHGVDMLYTWDADHQLTGVVVNVPCPSQVVEGKSEISADFWHEVRTQLREQPAFSPDMHVLPICGAAGDQAPRDLENHALTLEDTRGYRGTVTIGAAITQAIVAGLPSACEVRSHSAPIGFATTSFDLQRKPERERTDPFPVVLHALRIGDVAFVDNPFELYLEYGLDIRRCSPWTQTFIGQLASGPEYGMYLATPKAILGGGYGAGLKHGQVPPAGGKILVDKTVQLLEELACSLT